MNTLLLDNPYLANRVSEIRSCYVVCDGLFAFSVHDTIKEAEKMQGDILSLYNFYAAIESVDNFLCHFKTYAILSCVIDELIKIKSGTN